MAQLNQQLDIQFREVVLDIQIALKKFKDLEELAFDENRNIAFAGSVNLATEIGVPSTEIVKTSDDIDNFFLN